MTKDSTEGPRLSNFLTVLAGEIRRSREASRATYLEDGRKLIEAREHARRGEWGPFLAAASVSERSARDMMALARSGLTADGITELGGIRYALEWLREREKPATVASNGAPEPAESPALVLESPVAAGETRSVQASAAVPAKSDPRSATAPGPMTLYQWRRELAAIGDVLAPRIEAAVKAGEGIQLDAAEVAALARPPRRKRKAKR